ncbi:MAG: hypothetical protein RIQ81_933 [Pseudomonadota bacterium]|jgi:hypothetical protein
MKAKTFLSSQGVSVIGQLLSCSSIGFFLVGCSDSSTFKGEGVLRRLSLGGEAPAEQKLPEASTSDVPARTDVTTMISNCQVDKTNTRLSKAGFVEHVTDGMKPGVFGEPSALTGALWVSGGSNKPRGDGPARLDWRLCNKLAFYERGHSITRTIAFQDPSTDGEYQLLIHRVRFSGESYGVGLWYHWDERVKWTGNPLFKFNTHKDYLVTCSFKAAGPDQWTCQYEEQEQSAVDCSPWKRAGVSCRTLEMAE